MDKMADLVFNMPLDEETVDIIENLRKLRLWLAKKMLTSLSPTVQELISRGLIDEGDRPHYEKLLKEELEKKISEFQKRAPADGPIYSDELELYLKLLAEEPKRQSKS